MKFKMRAGVYAVLLAAAVSLVPSVAAGSEINTEAQEAVTLVPHAGAEALNKDPAAPMAYVYPQNCTYQIARNINGATARCTTGGGTYKAIAVCVNLHDDSTYYKYDTTWRRIGQLSTAYCAEAIGLKYAVKGAGIYKRPA